MIGPNHEFRAPTSFTSPNFSPNQSQYDHVNYSPTNTTSTTEHSIFASTPDSLLAGAPPTESFSSGSQAEISVGLPSPFRDDQPSSGPRKTPKNSICTYCDHAFTARGVKLHEQRCFRKREAEAAYLKETALQEAQSSATATKEMYESIIKQLSEELASHKRILDSTAQCLELSRQDHQIALQYADAAAKSLSASRDEVANLRRCLDSISRQNKRPSEYPGEPTRKYSRQSRSDENLDILEHNRTPITDFSINRLGSN